MQQDFQRMISSKLKEFGNTKFKIKETEFSISKLPPMAGFKVAENIRVALTTTADKFDAGNGTEEQNATLFFKALLGLPSEFVDYLMAELFEGIQFSGKSTGVEKGWAPLKGMEDSAFQDFEVINIYEVLWRALFINFSGSFSEITSAFPGVAQILKQLKPKI